MNKLSAGKVLLNEFETFGTPVFPAALIQSAKKAGLTLQILEEEIDCGGEDELAPVSSVADLLPADSWILAVAVRCTETFAGDVSNFDVGDEGGTATRFVSNSTKVTAGDTDVFFESAIGVQASDAKIELTLDDAATAGKVRVSVFALTFNAPTS